MLTMKYRYQSAVSLAIGQAVAQVLLSLLSDCVQHSGQVFGCSLQQHIKSKTFGQYAMDPVISLTRRGYNERS